MRRAARSSGCRRRRFRIPRRPPMAAPSVWHRVRLVSLREASTFCGVSNSTPRSRKGERTRTRLLEAAKQVFEHDGFLAARITDISKRARLSHGSFYHYFDSKEEIFRELAEMQEERLTEPAGDGRFAGTPDDSPREQIRQG